jgi:hypothetical protein
VRSRGGDGGRGSKEEVNRLKMIATNRGLNEEMKGGKELTERG